MPKPEHVAPLPPPRSPWFIAGLVVPVVVLGLALAWLGRPVERAPGKAAKAVDKWLAKAGEAGPAVVVLGNSLAWSATDRAVLGKAVGVPKDRIVAATVTGSRAPSWYAVLKNRVLAGGHSPDVVVVGLTLEWLLNPSLHSPRQREILLGQLSGDDPVIEEVVFGKEPLPRPVRNAIDRRGPVRSALVDGVRDGVARAVLPDEDPEQLLGEVFADDKLRGFDGPTGVMEALVDNRQSAAELTRMDGALPPDQGMLPAMLRLAEDNDLKLVFVRLPTSPGHTVDSDAALAHHAAVIERVNQSPAATWVDLTDLPLRPSDFADRLHYGPTGRKAVSEAIGAAVAALGEGPLPTAEVPAAPVQWSRTDTLAPLALTVSKKGASPCLWQGTTDDKRVALVGEGPLLRQGLARRSPFVLLEDGSPLERQDNAAKIGKTDCNGVHLHLSRSVHFAPTAAAAPDPSAHAYTLALRSETSLDAGDGQQAWWVPPGSTLTGRLGEGRVGTLSVLAVAAGGTGGAVVRVGEQDHALVPVSGGMVGVRIPLDAGMDRIAVSVPLDGPMLYLADVAVQGAGGARDSLLDPRRIEAWENRYLDGKSTDPVTVSGGPLPTLALPEKVVDHKGKARFVGLGPMLADIAALREQFPHKDATPVRVLDQGRVLPAPVERCYDVKTLKAGQACHNDKALYLGLPDGLAPEQAADRYGLGLREERLHRRDLWLYPGDVVGSEVHRRVLRSFPYATNELSLSATVPAKPRGLLKVRLFDGEKKLWEGKVRVKELAQGPVRLALDPRVRQRAKSLRIELALGETAATLVVTDLTFRQSESRLWADAVPQQKKTDAPSPAPTPAGDPTPTDGAAEPAP